MVLLFAVPSHVEQNIVACSALSRNQPMLFNKHRQSLSPVHGLAPAEPCCCCALPAAAYRTLKPPKALVKGQAALFCNYSVDLHSRHGRCFLLKKIAAHLELLAIATHLSQLPGMSSSVCADGLICILQLAPARHRHHVVDQRSAP